MNVMNDEICYQEVGWTQRYIVFKRKNDRDNEKPIFTDKKTSPCIMVVIWH